MNLIKKNTCIGLAVLVLSTTIWGVAAKAEIAWFKPTPNVEQEKISSASALVDAVEQARITDREQDRTIRIRQGMTEIKAVVSEDIKPIPPAKIAQVTNAKPIATRSSAKSEVNNKKSNPSASTSPAATTPPPSQAADQKTAIMGKSVANVNQLEKLIHLRNPNAPYLGSIYFRMEGIYHIRADIAFLQMVKETNALKFTGDVSLSQHNPAGIGATGGVQGATFASWDEGIEAQFQHLLAYASTSPIPAGRELVDPRFNLVRRGTAPYVEWLGKANNPYGVGWAWPGDGYGYAILNLLNEALKY